jgi:hypothetical protein
MDRMLPRPCIEAGTFWSIEVGNLTGRMHSGVRSSGTVHADRGHSHDAGHSPLDDILRTTAVGLALPSCKGPSVISECQFKTHFL